LRVLQSTDCQKRLDFFTQVRACRRRQQNSIESQAISRLFTTPDEFYLLNQRALYSQIRERLEERGLGIRDAFIAFDYNNDAILTCSELYGGLEWLGLRLTPEDIYSMVQDMNTSQKGTILYKEFKAALKDPYADENAPDRIAAVGVFDKVRIEPKQIVELTDLEDVPEDSEPLPPDAVKKIKLKFQVAKKFTAVWDTTKTRSQKPLSIWKPSMDTGVFKKNCVRLCLGHVAVDELKDPTKAKRLKKLPFEIIEVSDTGSGHKAVVDQVVQALFPYPLRFHLVWSQSRSKKPMYIWNAVPPSNKYVAMGMVLTDTEDPPDRDCMRCVCIHLLKPTEAAPVKIWDDAGGGGRPGSVWYVSGARLLYGQKGTNEPQRKRFYDFSFSRLILEESPEVMKLFEQMYQTRMRQLEQEESRQE